MISKIISILLIISASYTVAVFFAPTQADEIAALIGAPNLNDQIRALKTQADGVSNTLIDLKNNTGGILDNAKTTIDSARSVVENTRSTIEQKVDQTQAVVKSVQDLSQAASAVKTNLSTLTTLTGATLSGSASLSGSTSSSATASGTLKTEATFTGSSN